MNLRTPCAICGSSHGYIIERGSQDCVYCGACNGYQYNAPRTETGKAVRSLASRPSITPGQRARILAAHDNACVACGRRPPVVMLGLGHLISRADADEHGFLDELIDSEMNLAPMCAECNSGQRPLGSVALRLMYRLLVIKSKAMGG